MSAGCPHSPDRQPTNLSAGGRSTSVRRELRLRRWVLRSARSSRSCLISITQIVKNGRHAGPHVGRTQQRQRGRSHVRGSARAWLARLAANGRLRQEVLATRRAERWLPEGQGSKAIGIFAVTSVLATRVPTCPLWSRREDTIRHWKGSGLIGSQAFPFTKGKRLACGIFSSSRRLYLERLGGGASGMVPVRTLQPCLRRSTSPSGSSGLFFQSLRRTASTWCSSGSGVCEAFANSARTSRRYERFTHALRR